MRELKIEFKIDFFKNLEALPNDVSTLMKKAIEARENAYAPYSKFNVGVALLLDNNQIVTGNNQENAAYPSGLCAERTAIYYASAQFPKAKMIRMAISASSQKKETLKPIPPCGACRQAIAEYEIKQDKAIEIYFMGKTGEIAKSDSLINLLPLAFDKRQL